MATTVLTDHFQAALADMRAHYASGATQHFDLNNSVHAQALFAGQAMAVATPVPDILSGVAATAKTGAQTSLNTQTSGAQAAGQAAQQSKDGNDFLSKMEAQKAQAKADSDANIDQAYTSAEQLGTQNPDQQNAILQGMNTIMSTLNSVISGITGVISSLMDALSSILQGLMNIANAFAPVAGIIALL